MMNGIHILPFLGPPLSKQNLFDNLADKNTTLSLANVRLGSVGVLSLS